MRRLGLVALIVVAGGGFYLIRDVGHIPLFDAQLHRLAETPAEGYCAGVAFWNNRGQPDPGRAQECRVDSDLSTTLDLKQVQPLFCKAVTDNGYAGGITECIGILTGQKLWPTYDGGLTSEWSKTAPYPGDLVFVIPDSESRTGPRDGFSRDDPTTTSTTTAETTSTTGAP
jgi:hypothetical protein